MANLVLKSNTNGITSVKADRFLGAADSLYLNPESRLASANIDLGSSDYKKKILYMLATSAMTEGKPPKDGHILTFGWDSAVNCGSQLAIGNSLSCHIYLRGNDGSSWESSWRTVLDSGNYNSYAPSLTGVGASGTWGINITGNSATTSLVNVRKNINGSSHAEALKNEFDNYKNSIPRNSLLAYKSNAYDNYSLAIGYFLNGYNDTPYGGFYIAHYDNPYYVGISDGHYNQQRILTDNNYNVYALPLSGGTLTGKLTAKGGIGFIDSAGNNYFAIVDNGTNLWIGAEATYATHHTGETYISSGYNGTTGNPTAYICVPNAENYGGTSYGILHTGNYSSYALPITGGTLTGVLNFQTDNWTGGILAKNASGYRRYEIYSNSNTGAVADAKFRVFTHETDSTKYIDYTFGTDGILTAPNGFSGTLYGNASSATLANYVKLLSGNELNFYGNNTSSIWFNYRDASTGANTTTTISSYYFGNGQKGHDATIWAGSFKGDAVVLSKNGTIGHQGTKSYYSMIRFLDNTSNADGNGISIGGGGPTIIGGGESATTAQSLITTGGQEYMIVANDGNIDFYTNCQDGMSKARHFIMKSDGTLTIPGVGPSLEIGSLNSGFCHIMAEVPVYINQSLSINGAFQIYQMNSQGCGSTFPSNKVKGQIFFKI